MQYKINIFLGILLIFIGVVLEIHLRDYLTAIWVYNSLVFLAVSMEKDEIIDMYREHTEELWKRYEETVDFIKGLQKK